MNSTTSTATVALAADDSLQLYIDSYIANKKVDSPWNHILISMYTILIIVGATGNIIVVISVIRKPIMRTARNLFILNLAISDLLLCLITMPWTLFEILTKYWPLGNIEFLCKITGTLQAVSIFVSTISISAIALDRYQAIVYPTLQNIQIMGRILILILIWILASILASPLYLVRQLVHEEIPKQLSFYGISNSTSYCLEIWPIEHGRAYYSIFSLTIQYILPIFIVSGAYLRIYYKLKNRIQINGYSATTTTTTTNGTSSNNVNMKTDRRLERGRRMKRTNCLLISISLIFGISWLPLHIFNLYSDLRTTDFNVNDFVIYAICHMVGMSSACSHPLLYGWLNENFRKEFKDLLVCCCGWCDRFRCSACYQNQSQHQKNAFFDNNDETTMQQQPQSELAIQQATSSSSYNKNFRKLTLNTEISQTDVKFLQNQQNLLNNHADNHHESEPETEIAMERLMIPSENH